LLADCHGQLARLAIETLAPRFQPFLSDVPAELACTSERGVGWAFYARMAEKHGPAAVLASAGSFEGIRLDESAAPGDLIAMHYSIERLAQLWGPKRRSKPRALPGGLRTEPFAAAFPDIRGKARTALDLFIENSPLTRLVYADLVSLTPFRLSLRAIEPVLTAGRGAWMEVWLAQLARSFLGALLSPSPDLDELKSVQTEIASLRIRQRRSDSLEAAAARLRSRIVNDMFGRFQAARLMDPGVAGACPQGRLLRMRFLDMLVRHLVTAWMPRVAREWKYHPQRGLGRSRELLTSPESCREFAVSMCKLSPSEFPALLGERCENHRENLRALLNPPSLSNKDLEQLAEASGIPETAVRNMEERLSGDPGVQLPFGSSNTQIAEFVLQRWLAALLDEMPCPPPAAESDGSDDH
jgi:hypothetical protein